MKKKELPEELRDYDPYRVCAYIQLVNFLMFVQSYLGELIEAAEEEAFEREVINHY
jgi:hypothetical protein